MGIAQRIGISQQQKLALSPQLQLAIHVLQLNGAELETYLEAEAEKNPLLELPRSTSRNDGFSAVDRLGNAESMLESLQKQIGLMNLPPRIAALARALVGELEDSGYLGVPVFELADRLKASTCEIEQALTAMQGCEPAGIGARSLAESLALQLKAKNRFDPVMDLVLQNLDLVAAHKLQKLSEITGEAPQAVAEIIAEIKALNPKPGAGLLPEPVVDIAAEIEVKRSEIGDWRVELISGRMPQALLNQSYISELSDSGKIVRDFTRQNLVSAHWLLKALDQRKHTILKVATAIVSHQFAWFERGDIAMRPLTLAMIAAEIGAHESTVSRVTSGKYLICPRGTFELKYFFSGKVTALDPKTEFSACGVRWRIKHLIAQESYQNILSDEDIVNKLREVGVDIARRSVAKYREDMGISSSIVRRKKSLPQRG